MGGVKLRIKLNSAQLKLEFGLSLAKITIQLVHERRLKIIIKYNDLAISS